MKLSLKSSSAYLLCLLSISLLLSACRITSASDPNGGGSGTTTGGGGTTTTPGTFTIGGTVSGLIGTGLVLQDNAGDNLTVTANGTFTFATSLASAKTYAVTILTQPSTPAQVCAVSGGTGTVTANVTTVQVTCASSTQAIIGGQVTGLLGTGLVLQDNAGDNLKITANGSFTFAKVVNIGSVFSVTVLTQPTTPVQTCTVANASGTAKGNVGNVLVTCSAGTLSIGGSVSGLSGTGLILQDNGGDNLPIAGNGAFTFASLLPSGAAYGVSILTQPGGPAQTCTITNASGTATANVSNIQIICPAVFHTIGGMVTGLSVPTGQTSQMIIQDNGGDNLPITGNGPFTFVTPIAHGSAYDVTEFVASGTQPLQDCILVGWSGVAIANVTNVIVDCGHNDWTWMDGSNTGNKDATGDTSPQMTHTSQDNDTPASTKYPATWTDLNGNLWLFSGSSHAPTTTNVIEFFNTMWEFTGTGAANYDGGFNSYWTAVAPSGSTPIPRWGAVTWTDTTTGNLWLFGGQDQAFDFLSDLWFYNIGSKTWTQVSATFQTNGIYGTKGTASPSNFPGARWGATAKIDGLGNVWLFGGFGYADSTSGNVGLLNDLWKYTGGQWTWVSGSSVLNPNGVYGTEGTAATGNVPGGRQSSVSWMDSSGNLWLFGGYDLSGTGQQNAFNDLWKFSGGQWTWISGSNSVNQTATYGTQGVSASANVPGARWSPAAWSDRFGNFWLFGGFGFDATGNGALNDLWEYKGGQWIWVKGASSVSQIGIYGTAPGLRVWPLATNEPGSRSGTGYWTDSSGPYDKFWMFGGEGFDSAGGAGDLLLNDLWRYLPYPQ